MIVEKNTAIPMNDGAVLRANVFRPVTPGRHPVVMSFGIYGKDIHFADGYAPQWKTLNRIYPGIASNGSTGRWLRWELPDPERWVPDGFIVIAVDARGSGQSPGYLDIYSPRETQDYFECIEWAAAQPWSNGRVGLLGISYLAYKQWQVAALRPPHLSAIVPWEGASDYYRDANRHGGILSNSFRASWWPRQVLVNQNGNGETTHRDRDTGEATTGTPLPAAYLEGNRLENPPEVNRHELDDAWYRDRSPRLDRIDVPLLSAANWGGPGNHLRGNVEGFMGAASRDKWLFAHIGTHYESFYLPHYVAIQKRFFDRYLKGIDNGWEQEPRVQIAIRHVDGTAGFRKEHEWPLARTRWTPFHLDVASKSLTIAMPAEASCSCDAMGDGIDFSTAPFTHDTEITGPVVLKLTLSSSTRDCDLFVVLRCFDAQGDEVILTGAHERVPVSFGWLRASHRKLDPVRSTPWRPWHTHDEVQKLTPDEAVDVDVEILPTSMVYRRGDRLVLTIRGHDHVVTAPGRMLHNHPEDRPPHEFAGVTTIHRGKLVLPVIPASEQDGDNT